MIAVVKAYPDNIVAVRLLFHEAFQPDCGADLVKPCCWINSEDSIA